MRNARLAATQRGALRALLLALVFLGSLPAFAQPPSSTLPPAPIPVLPKPTPLPESAQLVMPPPPPPQLVMPLPPPPVLLTSEAPFGVPELWQLYVKTGPVLPLGGGFFSRGMHTGWETELGLQFPLFQPRGRLAPMTFFGDVGVGIAANGRDGPPLITSGTFYAPFDNHTHFFSDFYRTDFSELDRYTIHLALGSNWYPVFLNRAENRSIFFTGRFGVRAGAVDSCYSQGPTGGLVGLERAHINHGHDPALFQLQSDFQEPDTLVGLFGSVGVGLRFYDCHVGRLPLGDITLGAEAEFGHDWLYGGDSHTLSTISPLVSLAFGF